MSAASQVIPTADAFIPSRHGADLAEGRRLASSVRRLLRDKQAAEPSPALWREMGLALMQGDRAADALVRWMSAEGMKVTRAMFEQALEHGVDQVENAPAPLREFFKEVETLPAWFNPDLADRGAQATHICGVTGMRMMRNLGLMAGYQASALNKTLIMTGALERGAQRRVAETTKWWMDVTSVGGLQRFSPGFKTTIRVRMIHAMVRNNLLLSPQWRVQDWGLPINQADMMATYLGFSVVFLIGQRFMGVALTHDEAEALMHLWRGIGWLMGVDERWLFPKVTQATVMLYQNLLSQAPPDETSVQMGRALMDEPLQYHFTRFATLRRHWQRAVHLSICRAFLGPKGMHALGLPNTVLPWYPLYFAPCNWLWHRLHRALPGGRERLIKGGRARQLAQLDVLFGAAAPDIAAMPTAAARAKSHHAPS